MLVFAGVLFRIIHASFSNKLPSHTASKRFDASEESWWRYSFQSHRQDPIISTLLVSVCQEVRFLSCCRFWVTVNAGCQKKTRCIYRILRISDIQIKRTKYQRSPHMNRSTLQKITISHVFKCLKNLTTSFPPFIPTQKAPSVWRHIAPPPAVPRALWLLVPQHAVPLTSSRGEVQTKTCPHLKRFYQPNHQIQRLMNDGMF